MMLLQGKKVAVLGGGISGFCAARLAQSRGALVWAFDSGPSDKLEKARLKFDQELGIELITGESALHPQDHFDLAIISPGIDSSWPMPVAIQKVSRELIGEIEFAWRLSQIPTIAITGTNGKTTTTELTAYLLNQCGFSAIAAGNYGYAYSDVVYFGEPYQWVVLEVSSFQLETIRDFHPEIAVWINFAPDHMDRYKSLDDYRNAKLRIFENQTDDNTAICKLEDHLSVKASPISFSAFTEGGDYSYRDKLITGPGEEIRIDFSQTRLNGRHNAENVMAAVAAVLATGVQWSDHLAHAISHYQAPAHRCEIVGEKNGIIFVNDSKATNLHALESALRSQDEKVTLIAGGKNKGLDFRELNDLVARSVASVICLGEIGPTIAETWQGIVPCRFVSSLDEAVAVAYADRGETKVILFSPGTSSFDMFSGYEERGNRFREAVAALCNEPMP